MIITCIGHAEFLLEMENGMRIITDPYDAPTGYPVLPTRADVALVSHDHHDHSAVEKVNGHPRVIGATGRYDLGGGVTVIAVEAFHDHQRGEKRGKTLLFNVCAEGLRVAHLGDLGHLPTQAQMEALGPVDVLMLPVGGFYTIDAHAAKQTAEMLHARVILPMHYRTRANADWPIAPVTDFTGLFDAPAEEVNLLRVAQGDLICQPRVAVLRPQSLR